MGWIKWHTPRREQSVVITLESKRDTLILLDENGDQCEKLIINADIAKVKESTPPDPQVSDTRPSWQKIYSQSSVQDRISEYVSNNSLQELSWCTWSIGASWTQHWDWTDKRVSVITGGMTDPSSDTPYWDAETKTEDITFTSWGVDNHYFASATAERMSGKFYTGAVLISKADLQLEKVTYSVSMSAEATISPSDYCKTATYSESNGKYTMKSGYGIQINVDTHLSGIHSTAPEARLQTCCFRSLITTATILRFTIACLKRSTAASYSRRTNTRPIMTECTSHRYGSRTRKTIPYMLRCSTCGVLRVSSP